MLQPSTPGLLALPSSLAMPLLSLFVPYPVRKELLQSLSAYDIAKLDLAFGGILSHRERKLYLNPLRDLVEDIAEVQALEAYGIRLLVLGNDVLALRQRLQSPQDYIRKYGHRRKLQIYLVGLCPMIIKTTTIRDKLLNFTLVSAPSAQSVFRDTMQMKRIRAKALYGSFTPSMFVMSLGASQQQNKHHGFWLRAPAVPDSTIDMRLYVPSFLDRQRGEIHFPYREACNLSKCVLRKAWVLSYLADLLRMCLNIHELSVANMTSQDLHIIEPHGRIWLQKQMNIQTAVASRWVEGSS